MHALDLSREGLSRLEYAVFDTHTIARTLANADLTTAQVDAITDAVRQAAEHDAASEQLATRDGTRAVGAARRSPPGVSLPARSDSNGTPSVETHASSSRGRMPKGSFAVRPVAFMESVYGPLRRTYCVRLPGLVRGRLHNASSRAMNPSSGSASLACTSCVTWSSLVKRPLGRAGNVAERNEPVSLTRHKLAPFDRRLPLVQFRPLRPRSPNRSLCHSRKGAFLVSTGCWPSQPGS